MQPAEPTTNMVFVNVADGIELMQGTSYVNYTNAQYIVELISRLAASAPLFSAKSYTTDPFNQSGEGGQADDRKSEAANE